MMAKIFSRYPFKRTTFIKIVSPAKGRTHPAFHSLIDSPDDMESIAKAQKQNSIDYNLKTYPKYRYKPLDNNLNSFRLLRLLPAPDKSWPIRCQLFDAKLDNAPPYVALSYSWGDRIGSKPILLDSNIDGNALDVTQNLRWALQQLRPGRGEQPIVMWIDAICINQEDISERNIQTANMRAVYQHATSVAVWLGLQHHESAHAFALARDICSAQSLDQIKAMVEDPLRSKDFEHLVTLFRRQYWWRIWVIQEVACAKSAMVYCGEETMSWSNFDRVCDLLREVEKHLETIFYRKLSAIRTLIHGGPRSLQLSRYSPTESVPPLFELLITHKSKKSTDPRDKVYALVGISSSRHTFGIIDYSLSVRDTYTHTTRHIISTSQKLDIICIKQHNVNNFDLPTWVTDWTRPPIGATLVGLHHREPTFHAAGDTLANFRFSPDGYILHAKGFQFSTIKTAGMQCRKKNGPIEVVRSLEVFHNWWSLFMSQYTDSLPHQRIFAQLISCGTWNFKTDEEYALKLEAIFLLSDEMLADSDILRVDPPSRASTFSLSNSTSSLPLRDDEVEELTSGEDIDERTKFSAILFAGLTMNRRRLYLADDGGVGMALWFAEEGDIVCILLGCRFPVVLRPVEYGRFRLVGEAYVEGFMEGQGLEGVRSGRFKMRDFEIC